MLPGRHSSPLQMMTYCVPPYCATMGHEITAFSFTVRTEDRMVQLHLLLDSSTHAKSDVNQLIAMAYLFVLSTLKCGVVMGIYICYPELFKCEWFWSIKYIAVASIISYCNISCIPTSWKLQLQCSINRRLSYWTKSIHLQRLDLN